MPCPGCGKPHKRSKNGPCAACYMGKYRKTETGRIAVKNANKKSVTNNSERRFTEVVRYREKTGYYVPTELHRLFHAIKRLDRTVEATEKRARVCEPSQRRLDQSIERRDRYRHSTDLLRISKSGRTGRVE